MSHYGKIKPPGHRVGKRLQKSKVFGHGAHGKKSTFADLLITPLVDMFVIIVLFLIANFSASGEVLGMTKDIILPSASNVDEIQQAEVVQVSMNQIIVSGQLIGQIPDLIHDGDPVGPLQPIVEALKIKKQSWETTHRLAGDTAAFTGDINIQAHREVQYKVLAPVMMSCQEAGFGNINFATMQKGSDNPGQPQASNK